METLHIKNSGHVAKAALRAKFIASNVYIKIKPRSQINNLILELKELEKEAQSQ